MKSFTPRENDLATLVLRIGGPRLLYGFQQLNMLPSESSVYKKIRECIAILETICDNNKDKIQAVSNPYSDEVLDLFLLQEKITNTSSQTLLPSHH